MRLTDFRLAIRLLRRTPAFSTVALLSLALGVGANAALFSLVDALLMRPLPVRAPHELVFVHETHLESGKRMPIDRATFEAFAALNDVFSGLTASAPMYQPSVVVDGVPEPGRVVAQVSGEFFRVMGVGAAAGRLEIDNGTPAVVLSDRFWRNRFARDFGVLGRQLVVNDRSYAIAGVAQAGFLGVSVDASVDVWVFNASPQFSTPSLIGRLQRGVSQSQALAAIEAVVTRREAENPSALGPVKVDVLEAGRGASLLREQYGRALVALTALVVLLLFITCSNLGTLMVVRMNRRRYELAVRASLGAGRGRLFGQLMAESVVLAVAGGAFAWLIARWSVAGLLGTLPMDAIPDQLQFHGGVRTVIGVALLSLIGALAFGLLPGWRATRVDATASLRGTPAVSTSRESRRLGGWLMAAQVALSVVLLTGAGLFLRTLKNMADVDLGFDAHKLLQVELDRGVRMRPDEVAAMHRRLIQRVSAVAGVRDVTMSNGTFPAWAMGIEAPTGYAGAPIGPRYFETTGIPVVRGRVFGPDDVERSYSRPPGSTGPSGYAVVSEAFARETFPGEDPIGKRAGYGDLEIIGVVRDAFVDNVRWKMPAIYRLALGEGRILAEMLVRTDGNPAAIAADVRRAVAEVAQRLLVAVRPVDDAIARSLARERLVALTSGFFGLFGVVLAGIGLFGLAASSVLQRTNELGLRIALGASRRDVVRDALGGTMAALTVGLAVGALAATAVVRVSGSLVASMLFGLDATDGLNLAMAVLLLTTVAAASCLVPALRAIRISPLAAMKDQNL